MSLVTRVLSVIARWSRSCCFDAHQIQHVLSRPGHLAIKVAAIVDYGQARVGSPAGSLVAADASTVSQHQTASYNRKLNHRHIKHCNARLHNSNAQSTLIVLSYHMLYARA